MKAWFLIQMYQTETSISKFVKLAAKHLNKNIQLTNVSTDFIQTQIPDINFAKEFPLWIYNNCLTINSSRLQKDFNFTFSTIEETTERLMDYYGNHLEWRDVKESRHVKTSMTVEREAELLKLLEERTIRGIWKRAPRYPLKCHFANAAKPARQMA